MFCLKKNLHPCIVMSLNMFQKILVNINLKRIKLTIIYKSSSKKSFHIHKTMRHQFPTEHQSPDSRLEIKIQLSFYLQLLVVSSSALKLGPYEIPNLLLSVLSCLLLLSMFRSYLDNHTVDITWVLHCHVQNMLFNRHLGPLALIIFVLPFSQIFSLKRNSLIGYPIPSGQS